MRRVLSKAPLLLLIILLSCGGLKGPAINFSHLDHLYQSVQIRGKPMGILHIYAEAPDYHWAWVPDEGIACVDDAARGAVAYLRQYRFGKDSRYLDRAGSLLRFILHMQTPEGYFHNFILEDYRINRSHPSSRKSFGWWAARGVWALAEGYVVFRQCDPGFAERLEEALRRSFRPLRGLLARYGEYATINGRRYPLWLVQETAADATSELLQGLLAYYEARGDPEVRGFIEKLAEGLICMQYGDFEHFPYGAYFSYVDTWHPWGNNQMAVLARAGRLLGRHRWIESAQLEAEALIPRLLVEGFKVEPLGQEKDVILSFPQIAYSFRPLVWGLLELSEATGEGKYAIVAGLVASWFTGNNPPQEPMYDPRTGRCYDGIDERGRVNRNSGAESTIEALLTLMALRENPKAIPYLYYRFGKRGELRDEEGKLRLEYREFLSRKGSRMVLLLDLKKENFYLLESF